MTDVSVTLPDELLAALRREARRRKTSVSAIAREAFAERFGLSTPAPKRASRDATTTRHGSGG
jgi:predicted transcriptional regulator